MRLWKHRNGENSSKAITRHIRNHKTAATVAAIGVIGVIGLTMAYFTGTDAVTNRINAASIGVKIVEEKYDDLTSHVVKPGYAVDKDPKVKNTGECPIYVFLAVTIPTADVRTMDLTYADEDVGKTNPTGFSINLRKDQELFSYSYVENETTKENHTDWQLMTGHALGGHTYLFAYTGGTADTMKALAPNDSTEVVFNKVTLLPTLYAWNENELAKWNAGTAPEEYGDYIVGDTETIRVQAYVVQSEEIGERTTPNDVWTFLNSQ